ncbi:hypothetical protein [Leptolyngbya sp. FACHB-261]|uniref:hypothetical protein n=1 Tax=Leptolyngbya sp. FACHB-261 TaxID=2692806 RepID=UPI001F549A29|nr:hypothetical protein [Leptolyngbya sp. FACHB-261]
MELRRLQMLTEVGAEQNTTTVIMMPSDFISLAKNWSDAFQNAAEKRVNPAGAPSDHNPTNHNPANSLTPVQIPVQQLTQSTAQPTAVTKPPES